MTPTELLAALEVATGPDQQPYPKFKEIDRDTYNALRRFRNRAAKDDKKGRV